MSVPWGPLTRSRTSDLSFIQVESAQEIKDFHASGDLAYVWSHISVVMTAAETGARTERSGHVLTVFRKSPSGEWRLARDGGYVLRRRCPPG